MTNETYHGRPTIDRLEGLDVPDISKTKVITPAQYMTPGSPCKLFGFEPKSSTKTQYETIGAPWKFGI